MNAVEIRLAGSADAETVLAHMRSFYAEDGYSFDEARTRRLLEAFLGDPSLGRLWVFEAGEEIVGYFVLALGFSFEFGGRDAFLDELYVAPAHRGRGLGARALATLEEACRELGVSALHLEVERRKTDTQRLYRRAGYEDHDRYLMTKRIR
jgi:GNAT superfamily N-acetyltransferase